MAEVWRCEGCGFSTAESEQAAQHASGGHVVRRRRVESGRLMARPDNTGPGALLTDGERMFEVTDCKRRAVKSKTSERQLVIAERRLVDAALADSYRDGHGELVDRRGVWTSFAEVMRLEVVREVAYDGDGAAG